MLLDWEMLKMFLDLRDVFLFCSPGRCRRKARWLQLRPADPSSSRLSACKAGDGEDEDDIGDIGDDDDHCSFDSGI